MLLLTLASAAGLFWAGLLLLPWAPWRCRETLEAREGDGRADLSDVCALIPARNEADLLPRTLRALARQGEGLEAVVVDDRSSDGTAEAARRAGSRAAGLEVRVLSGAAPPSGWTGKLWALEQGRRRCDRPLILLLDADVRLAPGTVPALRGKMEEEGAGLASLMARPRMQSPGDRLLMPAFVYFFKLLYPFSLVSSPGSRVAAAAGGCALLRSEALGEAGGFRRIRGRIIDDCALAERVKEAGHRTWIGLTRSARSLRSREGAGEILEMIERTAFAQLRYSAPWLAGCTLLMALAFWAPPAALAAGAGPARALGAASLGLMAASYLPVLRYYGRSSWWALALPAVAAAYLWATWRSAIAHWRGRGSRWKGRRHRPAGPGAEPPGPGR